MKIKRIKAYVRKSFDTCEKCKYSYDRMCKGKWCREDCEAYLNGHCRCVTVKKGEPCKHFERAVQ